MSWLFALCGQSIGKAFSISPSKEYSGLISSKIDWFDLLAVQGTLKSLQHHSSKASILQHSVFFMVQLSHLYMTTGRTIALTTWTFVGEVMSLLFSTLSGFVITFQPRSNCLLISGFVFFTKDIFYLFVYQEAIKIHLSTLRTVVPRLLRPKCWILGSQDTKIKPLVFKASIIFQKSSLDGV